MPSTNLHTKVRPASKVLLRSTSFQKLCSIPYSFKIEAIRSYKEHIKTVIKLLKVATRAYVVSAYFKIISFVLFNQFGLAVWNFLKISCLATGSTGFPASTPQTSHSDAHSVTSRYTSEAKPPRKQHDKLNSWSTLDPANVGIQTFMTYSCIGYVLFQMAWLVNVLACSSSIPLGLVFLIMDLGYMGFIIFKIALKGIFSSA